MTVRKLIKMLRNRKPTSEVLLSMDKEGNFFHTFGRMSHEGDYIVLWPTDTDIQL